MAQKPKDVNLSYNMKVYWGFIKKYIPLISILLAITIIVEMTRVVDKFFFKWIIERGTDYSAGLILREPFVQFLLIIAFSYIGLLFGRAFFKWIYLNLIIKLEANVVVDLKKYFFNHVLHLSHHFHTSHRTGSLISKMVRGGRAMEAVTDVIIFNITPLILQLILVSASLILFDWMAAVVVFITVTCFVGYSLFMQQIQRPSNVYANDLEDFEKSQLSDFLMNIDSIKYFGKEQDIKSRFSRSVMKTKAAMITYWNYGRWLDSGQSIILGLGTFFLLLFPFIRLINHQMDIATVVFIYTIYTNLFGPLFGFVHGMRHFYRAMADFEPLFRYGLIENEVKDKSEAKKLDVKEGEIEFRNVDFSYHKRKIFSRFNLKIGQDKKIALVGHSGCGKTTLVKLLYRLYDVNKGAVLIDGKDIRDVKQESLRSELSIVPQECMLFDDTVYNNIAFSRPGASKREVMKAMKFAQLDQVVKDFPKKENTIVGERGVKLSGGEKQRVSIARAILADKKILVLDEATSSLDSQTEHEIQGALQKLMVGRTSIIIAHRLSTIMKADQIIVMKRGKIIQMGNHQQLIKLEGEYKKLWSLQKGGYIK